MSRYDCQYVSASKGAQDIDGLHDLHLLNAYRKLDAKKDASIQEQRVLACMAQEIKDRGLDPFYADGRVPEQEYDDTNGPERDGYYGESAEDRNPGLAGDVDRSHYGGER